MILRAVLSITATFLVPLASQNLSASGWYVDISVTHSGNGSSWGTAFKTIWEGINASSNGDTVLVAEGTYIETIRFNGKNVTLTSTDPLDPEVVAKTIVDARGLGPVVTFDGTEGETCILSGFTIRNGSADNGGGICGGTSGQHTHATIRYNVISRNLANKDWPHGHGGGIAFCDGLIEHNRVVGNMARRGGGFCACNGTIRNNVVVGNSADIDGGGFLQCFATIENNTIVRNFAQLGGGISHCDGTIRNCIVWGNGGGSQLSSFSDPSYSCIGLWTGGGVGNISVHPYFVDAGQGDYHLKSWSPCINAGDPASPFSEEPSPNGGRVNMGAYGNTPEATSASQDSDEDGLPDHWELHFFENLLQTAAGNPDADGLSNIEEYRRGLDPTSAAIFWYVDASAATSGDGTSWETAFHTIQEGLDAAADGDTILVSMGTYVENIDFDGKNVVLQSGDPDDPAVVTNTVIDGNHAGSAVIFNGNENESCILAGFTIRNGSCPYGGGIRGEGTLATIRKNTITGNSAEWYGGGLSGCDGLIEDNTISENESFEGGGLAYCAGTIRDNTIAVNSATTTGGGLCDCGGTIERNEITENSAFDGGGLAYCDGAIKHNTVSANSAEGNGGGLHACSGDVLNNVVAANTAKGSGGAFHSCCGTIQNNTIYGNLAEGSGGGLSGCYGTILNCIIWRNYAPEGAQLFPSSVPTYSCIQNWTESGEGNIAYYPHFADAPNGDYHLMSWSPCIDAGDPASDCSNEPEPNGGRINMGAYGNTSEATCASRDDDHDGLPDEWEMEFFGDLAQGPDDDPDGDLTSNLEEYYEGTDPLARPAWHVDGRAPVSGHGRSWEEAFKTIQEGIDAAFDGDTVLVSQGTYFETIQFGGKSIKLSSTDPLDPDVVQSTIIDAVRKSRSVVSFDGTQEETCVLSGFTIRNGRSEFGGGICGGTEDKHSRATIENNVIVGNEASDSGGALAYCGGAIQNNSISGNSALSGGGLYDCKGVIQNNAIAQNSAEYGGGLAYCDGTIRNNIIAGNSAGWLGGGMYDCNGTIQNNLIRGNSADYGGGLAYCDGTIQNNTICGNSAEWGGGGVAGCHASIHNSVIWGNVAPEGPQLYDSSVPTYSCMEGWTGGEGNIGFAPYFVDPEAEDYHLRSWSPCIDAGDPSSDFSNEPEPNGGRVNMGAYGNTAEAACKSADKDSDGLPDDWELHWFGNLEQQETGDPDGDRILLATEYRYGWNPTMAAESLVENRTKPVWYEGIQAALLDCDDGDEIVVHPGVYKENIGFGGRNVILRSTDPLNPVIVENTVIDGNKVGSVVTFAGTEDERCILSGFTITNGIGGISGAGTHATIQNNTITENSGSGVSDCDGSIRNNIITTNSAWSGGGLYECDGIVLHNTISGNSASSSGGGGLDRCDGIIQNNEITSNWTRYDGGGLYRCGGTIGNNTIAANQAGQHGGGLSRCDGDIINCIIWGNAAPDRTHVYNSSDPTYSCVHDWSGGGEGNIAEDPAFISAKDRNFRLGPDSPCVDRGRHCCWLAWPQRDLDGNCRLVGERVDMGCYEHGSSPDSDGDLLSDEDEVAAKTNPELEDTDGDGLRDGLERLRGSDPLAVTPPGVLHVPSNVRTIQGALCVALSSDEVIVAPGTYRESIVFCGVEIVLRSSDPENPDIVASTVLEGSPAAPVVCFRGSESESCVLSGFTVTNGAGGVNGAGTHATIQNNVITANSGSGLGDCDGPIQENSIIGNAAGSYGGGLYGCDGIVENNVISGNSAGTGGGLYECEGAILNNIITRNSATGTELSGAGGGLCGCHGTILNNIIAGNSAGFYGGGLCACQGTIENNTISGNSADWWGGGVAECHGSIQNSVIWGNVAPEGPQLYDSSVPTYSCIEGWTGGGEENIVEDPKFVDADGPDDDPDTYEDNDYHLAKGSACIDAGVNGYWFLWPQRDLDGNCRVVGERVDMGCYENGSSRDSDGDFLSDEDEMALGTDPLVEDTDGDGLRDGLEILRGSDPLAATPPRTVQVPSGISTIQEALCLAVNGDEVIVAPGTYRDNIVFPGVDVVLRSSDPENPEVVASTILDGGQTGPVVRFTGKQSEACVLSGFTIQNGRGGIAGAQSHATIRSNVIAGNSGSGISNCHGTIENNAITGNRAALGAGLRDCDGTIRGNTICGNATFGDLFHVGSGGGLYECDGIVLHNTISGNSASSSGGGGLCECQGTILNNIITGNSAIGTELAGVGGGLFNCHGTILNNIITGNSAGFYGGGLCGCQGTIENNTICGNSADWRGGGLESCSAEIRNCIIWGNAGGSQLESCRQPTYCCIQHWAGAGEGNIAEDPRFVDPDNGNFRLLPDSACIDSGMNEDWMWEAVDLDGNPRVMNGTVDMGAYEYPGYVLLAMRTRLLPSGKKAEPYSHTFAAVGGEPPYLWSVLSGLLPGGLDLSLEGVLSGTPTENGNFSFEVQVADSQNPADSDSRTFRLHVAPQDLAIATTSLPGGVEGRPYSHALQATGGVAPYIWSIVEGSLPDGLSFDPSTGFISDRPNSAAVGTWVFTVRVTDSGSPADAEGIVAYWTFDEGSGITAGDSVGTNHGTVHGATWVTGRVGAGLSFDGVDDFVEAPTTGLPTGSSDRTLQLWFKLNVIPTWGEAYLAGYGNFGSFDQVYVLGTWGDSLFFSQWGTGIGGPSLVPDQWYHAAVTNVGNSATLYLDGTVVGNNTQTINTPAGTQFYAGRIPGSLGDQRRLDGLVDEVAIFNRALSKEEILQHYEAGLEGQREEQVLSITIAPCSHYVLGITRDLSGAVQIIWKSRAGDTYTVWSCSDLTSGEWNEEATVSSQGQSTNWVDLNPSSACKFYEIEIK